MQTLRPEASGEVSRAEGTRLLKLKKIHLSSWTVRLNSGPGKRILRKGEPDHTGAPKPH